MKITLKPEAAGCNFDLEPVRREGDHLVCTECGHRMPIADYPDSDKALHQAAEQAKAFEDAASSTEGDYA